MTRRQGGNRHYPRTARLNRLVQEILGDALERVDDPRLEMVTVTEVVVDADLRHARVFYDSLQGEEGDPEVLEALAEARVGLQAAIARQARIKRTPELDFRPDPAVRTGERVDRILREVAPDEGE
jgi:ribosome-binding factor A